MAEQCDVRVLTCLQIEFPDVNWRTDLLIPTPQLIFPYNDRSFCLEAIPLGTVGLPPRPIWNSQICLSWEQTPGADTYLLQWSLNSDFNGPSVRETILNNPVNPTDPVSYCLIVPDDIRQGNTIYWRVIAANLNTGGVSNKSEVRKLSYTCGENQNRAIANRCDEYNVEITLISDDVMGICDERTIFAQLSADCQDFLGVQQLDIVGTTWTTSTQQGSGEVLINKVGGRDLKATVTTCLDDCQVFGVRLDIEFRDNTTGDTFICSAERTIYADSANTSCTALSIPEEFSDEACGILDNVGESVDVKDSGACNGDCGECDPPIVVEESLVNGNNFPIVTTDAISFQADCSVSYSLTLDFVPAEAGTVTSETIFINKKTGLTVSGADSETNSAYVIDYNNISKSVSVIFSGCIQDALIDIGAVGLGNSISVGYELDDETCIKTPETTYAYLCGPVFKVVDECGGNVGYLDWDCPPDCFCDNNLVSVEISGVKKQLALNQPVNFYSACDEDCPDCIGQGEKNPHRLEVTLTNATPSQDCQDADYTIEFKHFCNDVQVGTTVTHSETVGCDQTDFAGPIPDISVEDLCTVPEPILSLSRGQTTPAEGQPPCNCLPEQMTTNILYNGNTEVSIPGYTYDGTNITSPECNQTAVDGVTFAVYHLLFDCELYTLVAASGASCVYLPDLGGACCDFGIFGNFTGGFFPRQYTGTVDVTIGGNSITIPVVIDFFCNETEGSFYRTTTFTAANADGCGISGRITFNPANGDAFFEGSFTNGQPANVGTNVTTFSCNSLDALFNTSFNCFVNGSNQSLSLIINLDGTAADTCGACEEIVQISAVTCQNGLFSNATISGEIDGRDLTINLVPSSELCSCVERCEERPLEARVNIPLDCSLEINKDSAQKKIGLHFDNVIANGTDLATLEVGANDECRFITIPVCKCINGIPLVKNSTHIVTTDSDVDVDETTSVTFGMGKFDGEVLDDVTNIGPSEIDEGTQTLLFITDECKCVIMSGGAKCFECCEIDELQICICGETQTVNISSGSGCIDFIITDTNPACEDCCDGVLTIHLCVTKGCEDNTLIITGYAYCDDPDLQGLLPQTIDLEVECPTDCTDIDLGIGCAGAAKIAPAEDAEGNPIDCQCGEAPQAICEENALPSSHNESVVFLQQGATTNATSASINPDDDTWTSLVVEVTYTGATYTPGPGQPTLNNTSIPVILNFANVSPFSMSLYASTFNDGTGFTRIETTGKGGTTVITPGGTISNGDVLRLELTRDNPSADPSNEFTQIFSINGVPIDTRVSNTNPGISPTTGFCDTSVIYRGEVNVSGQNVYDVNGSNFSAVFS
jgi:hypothetical protein